MVLGVLIGFCGTTPKSVHSEKIYFLNGSFYMAVKLLMNFD
jgi:hypothetical protein